MQMESGAKLQLAKFIKFGSSGQKHVQKRSRTFEPELVVLSAHIDPCTLGPLS